MANRDFKKIKRTIQDFSLSAGDGNGNGGSVIVDSLPANGVEGQTYLLRKTTEKEIIKFKMYGCVCSYRREMNYNFYIVSDKYDSSTIDNYLHSYYDIMEQIPDGGVNWFSDSCDSRTEESFNEDIEDGSFTIIESVADLPEILDEKQRPTIFLKYLGEFTIGDLKMIEYKSGNDESIYFDLTPFFEVDTGSTRIKINQDELDDDYRQIEYQDENLVIGEWERMKGITIVERLTDAIEDSIETLRNWRIGEGCLISLTPEESDPTYSYTEYVFDKGIYAQLGANVNHDIYVEINTGAEASIYFTMRVDKVGLTTAEDIFNYLEEKGFVGETTRFPYTISGFYNMDIYVSLSAYYQPQEEAESAKVFEFFYPYNNAYRSYSFFLSGISSINIKYLN